ncbi:unnamed protein product [Mytilus coruscus]|uniref:Uncharacterized protein n=1 Tax=Mytilus coruscus TaxID=42192 RepID=A0A6J8AE11_MYTCO|nr:unnamed protein product [Mytilus coruscus]
MVNTTLGETILRLLMNSGCTAYLKNMSGQLPIDYLKPTDQGFTLLQAAKNNAGKYLLCRLNMEKLSLEKVEYTMKNKFKQDEEIRKRIIMFKNKGNDALKNTNNGHAIQMYTKGLQLCGDNSALKREAAVLLSNRSNVYSMMGMHKEALKDADESIKSDSSWYKGYWRKGQELKQMKRFTEAYTTFLSMFTSCYDVYPGDKLNFMTEAAVLFKDIPDLEKRDKYKMLSLGDQEMWSNILIKLSKTVDWLTIRYLLMGMSTDVPKDPVSRGVGVAAQAATNSMSFGSVFEYLKTVRYMTITASWLTPTLVVLLYRHKGNYLNFLADERDTCVHAVVRYAVITGHIDLLNLMQITSSPFRDEYLDGRRETPFHIITKYKHTEDVGLMVKVARVLIAKKFTASMIDMDKCLAIDYVSEEKQKPLYDVLAKITWKEMQNFRQYKTAANKPLLSTKDEKQPSAQSSVPKPGNVGDQGTQTKPNDSQVLKGRQATQTRHVDPQVLKERGNEEFRKGNYLMAAEIYTEAIGVQKAKMKEHVHHSRDLAILYGNRSECYLKTFVLDRALDDAMESVSYDGHWFKAHMKVGKVLAAKEVHEGALQAYTNALNELALEKAPEKSQREILASYCFHYMNLDKYKYPVEKKVTDIKIATHTWAMVTYDFIAKGNWHIATFSYLQFKCDPRPRNKVEKVNLRPICVLQHVKNCAWCIDLLEYFLTCGSDYNTMTTYTGDRYFHATIRLCIASETLVLLEYVLQNIVVRKGDQNLQDDKGNTALHTLTRDQEVDGMIRLRFIIMLLEAEVNPLIKNYDGKYAVMYLPRNEQKAIEILTNVMRQQEDVEKRIKQQKMQQQRQEEARKQQSQSKPNASATPQGRQPQHNRRQEDEVWKQSYMPKQQPSRPAYDKCRRCDEILEECRTKIKNRTGYAYFDMAKVIKENNHNKERHQKIVDEMLLMITDSIAKTLNPEIPERLAKIPYKYYQRIVTGLVKGENWRQLDVVVDEHRKHHGQTDLLDYAKGIKLPRVIIHSSLKGSHQLLTKIIESMLKSGAVIENEGKRCIQAAVQEEQFKVLETLFQHGACPSHLSVNQGDTPIHAALSIAIERDRGNFSIFNLFLEMFEKDPEKYHMLDPNEQDKNGDSLYHLVAKMKYNSTVQKATELLCDKKISSNVKNNEGKLPIHYLNAKNDRRLQFFRLASVGGPTKISSKKPKATGQQKKSVKTKVDNQLSEQNEGITEAEAEDLLQYERAEEVPTIVEKPVIRQPLRKEALRRRIEELIYELDDVAYSKYSSRADNLEKPSKKSKKEKAESQVKQTPKPQDTDQRPVTVEPRVNQEPEPLQLEIEQESDDDEEESLEEQFQVKLSITFKKCDMFLLWTQVMF